MTTGGNTVGELNVALTAKTENLMAGVAQAKAALGSVGDAAKQTGVDLKGAFSAAGQLLSNVSGAGGLSGLVGSLGAAGPLAIGAGAGYGIYKYIESLSYEQENRDTVDKIAGTRSAGIGAIRQSKAERALAGIDAKYNALEDPIAAKRKALLDKKEINDAVGAEYYPGAGFMLKRDADQLAEYDKQLRNIDSSRDQESKVYKATVDRENKAKLKAIDDKRIADNEATAAAGSGDAGRILDAGTVQRLAGLRAIQADLENTKADLANPTSQAVAEIDAQVNALEELIKANIGVNKQLHERLDASRQLYELQFNSSSAAAQSNAASIGVVTFGSNDAIAGSGNYLGQIALILSGRGY